MTQEAKVTKLDRMRYTKDSTSANMVYVAIVLNVLYYVGIYQMDHASEKPSTEYLYYTWLIGASVIYNLLFLLIGFLSSVGVKERRHGYTPILVFLGVMQIVRIFYLPAKAHAATYVIGETTYEVMTSGQYAFSVAALAVSGALCVAAGVLSYLNNKKLADYMKSIEN